MWCLLIIHTADKIGEIQMKYKIFQIFVQSSISFNGDIGFWVNLDVINLITSEAFPIDK